MQVFYFVQLIPIISKLNKMKTKAKTTITEILNLRLLALLCAITSLVACSSDDDNTVEAPEEEEEVEVITDLTLIFTPVGGGDVVMASAQDPDGEGIEDLEVLNDIVLAANTEYTLSYAILNGLDVDDVEDIAEEIEEEDDEHQIFYGFTEDIFSSPMGDGNIDTAADAVNYNDEDENGLNVGLSTSWTTGAAAMGTFRVRLQHQPDIKNAGTGANDGDTDFDVTFGLTIQ